MIKVECRIFRFIQNLINGSIEDYNRDTQNENMKQGYVNSGL